MFKPSAESHTGIAIIPLEPAGPPPSAWLRIICQSAPLPSLCLPAPSPVLRSLARTLAGWLAARSFPFHEMQSLAQSRALPSSMLQELF